MSFSEWKECKLEDFVDILSGYAFKSKDFCENEVPVIKIKNIIPPNVNFSDVQYVSEELYNDKIKYALKFDDILISLTGSNINQINSAVGKVGRVKVKDVKLLLNQRVGKVYVKDENKYSNDFLYYYLIQEHVRYDLASSAGGSANQANINPQNIKDLKISLPDIETQKAIAKILSDLDNKIEVNNKINERLEEMAQSIFKHWFVDFEFPNEEGKPYKSSGGEMVESELGMIPKGWEVKHIKDFGEVITGKTPSTKKEENYGDKYPFITIPDMHNSMYINKTVRYLSEEGNNAQPKKLIPKRSLIVSCIATVGLVSINIVESHTNQQINSIVPNNKELLPYLYFDVKSKNEYLNLLGSAGTTTKNVNKTSFENIKLLYPNEIILQKYYNTVQNAFRKTEKNIIENERLIDLRDNLLPKLMSGEIRVGIDKTND